MDAIEDIYDGKEYKKMSQPNGFLAESKNNFFFFDERWWHESGELFQRKRLADTSDNKWVTDSCA